MAKSRVRVMIVLVVILLLAYGLRLHALEQKAFWWDEAWSVWVSNHDFAQATELVTRDVHPPVYQWLLFGWIRLAGIGEFAARMLSLFAGLLTVAVAYPLTKRLSRSRAAAVLAAFFLAIAPLHVHWSQETRMYATVGFFAAAAVYAYLRVGERWSRWWGLLIVSGTAAILTHYLAGFVLVLLNLHWLLTWRSRKRAFHWRWVAAMVITGLLFGVWMLYAFERIRRGGGGTSSLPIMTVYQLGATLLAVGQSVDVEAYTVSALLVTAALTLGLALYCRRDWHGGLLVVLFALLPPLVIYVQSIRGGDLYAPKPEERYFVIFLPVVYAGVGVALYRLRKTWRVLGIAAALGLMLLYAWADWGALDHRYFRDDHASIVGALDLLAAPGDTVVFITGERYPLVYYNLDRRENGRSEMYDLVGVPDAGENVDGQMQEIVGDRESFWLLEIEPAQGDPQGRQRDWIATHYARLYHTVAGFNALSLYVRPGAEVVLPDSATVLPPPITEARPGDLIRIGAPGGQPVDLLHGDEVIVSQAADHWQLLEFPVYPNAAPGEYALRVDGVSYPFRVTHVPPLPDRVTTNIDAPIGPLRLLGYDIDKTTVRSGETLTLTFYWQAEARPDDSYTVFFHLLGPYNPATGGPVWDASDSYPAGIPTELWWDGLLAYDRRSLRVPEDMPPGRHAIEVGLYQAATGERLLTPGGEDHVIVTEIEVVE